MNLEYFSLILINKKKLINLKMYYLQLKNVLRKETIIGIRLMSFLSVLKLILKEVDKALSFLFF